ncbi:MAG TPA: hypothetical protein VMY88_00540, partial [Acidimicrobiales bacterium]|nr:hypothetical protein [Acidimicrobiales bacterium]
VAETAVAETAVAETAVAAAAAVQEVGVAEAPAAEAPEEDTNEATELNPRPEGRGFFAFQGRPGATLRAGMLVRCPP